ncbi:MAG: methionine--tRNA ligase subunit beta, partial [Clostridia bacterium]|nr:methionine--tRNA ligase subunit beta [Clostridia bacterium]
PAQILKSLSFPEDAGFDSLHFGTLQAGAKIEKLPPLFPRIDIKKELEAVAEFVKQHAKEKAKAPEKQENKEEAKPLIGIEDFERVNLRVGEVIACERVEKSDKLLHETVKIGDEVRSIVSGIAKYYTPEEMVGKKVIVVANLKPVKLRGVLSEGMLLCAEDSEGNLSLVSPEKDMTSGGEVR